MLPSITKADLETPRHARELYEWVRQVHHQFGETAEGRKAMQLHTKPILKKFCEEVWPLALYAKAYFEDRADVSFKPIIGDQDHDAELIDDRTGACVCFFEVTQALDGGVGYQERLRMECLQDHGIAPMWAELNRGPGGIVLQGQDTVRPSRDWIAETICLIREAIQRKTGRLYHQNTVLIVEYIDRLNLRCQKEYEERLTSEAESNLFGFASLFAELAIVASSGDLALRKVFRDYSEEQLKQP
jgi:hypothetical protein